MSLAQEFGNINLLNVEKAIMEGKLSEFKKYDSKKDRTWLFGGDNEKKQAAINAYMQYLSDQKEEAIEEQAKNASENNAEAADTGIEVNEDLPGAQVPVEESGSSETAAMTEQLSNFKKDLQKNVKQITKKISEFIKKINDILAKARSQSQKWIDDKIKWVKDQYKKYQKIAQKWIDAKVKIVDDWVKKQIDRIKKAIKRGAAYTAAGLVAMATKKSTDKKLVDKFAAAVPDPPIPVPPIPRIVIPFPELPIPAIKIPEVQLPDVGAMLDRAANNVINTAEGAVKGAASMGQGIMNQQVSNLTGGLI